MTNVELKPETYETNYDALQWPIYRAMCPEMDRREFEAMRLVVCGLLFGDVPPPEA